MPGLLDFSFVRYAPNCDLFFTWKSGNNTSFYYEVMLLNLFFILRIFFLVEYYDTDDALVIVLGVSYVSYKLF